MWPSYHPKLSRCSAWATLHTHTKYTPYNAKTGNKERKKKQVFRVKKLVGRQWGAPNSNYLLAMGWPGTFVMPFSITLNASHTHIKQTHTCIHRHTQTCTDTPTHIIQAQTYTRTHTHHTDTHTTCIVCVCVYVCAHGNPQTYT